ncbi:MULTISPECIES: hypothetical protein [Bacillaceae]|uniref:DUF5050 domain-containing protein n=1 Tax=Metabacillus sediminis TaxID=3117746 RepID=A0ABZ2NEE5_9BACI|nr:hypothetical protein [Bacillus sp. SJS]KZZ83293.1 hypothetical protein AS29_016185 [Bacillus sp. SJS]
MKKYWKTMLITIIAVLGIGSFYVQSAYTKSLLPDFKIKTESGSKDIGSSISLFGSYYMKDNQEYTNESLRITEKGSEYHSRLSIIDQQDRRWFGNTDFERIHKDYRDFMRGNKEFGEIFEDEKWLVSAQLAQEEEEKRVFTFAIMDKNTKKQMKFDAKIPVQDRSLFYVTDVQRVNNQLKVLVYGSSDANRENYTLYTFNIKSRELAAEQRFGETETKNKENYYITLFNELDPLRQSDYTAYIKNYYKQDGEDNQLERREYYVINNKTGTEEKISLPSSKGEIQDLFLENSHVYYTVSENGKMKALRYDIKAGKIDLERFIPISKKSFEAVDFKEGVMYAAGKKNSNESYIKAFSMKTGEEVYSGKIVNRSVKANMTLDIHSISIPRN